jgi:DNA mismatch repair protein MutS2
MEETIERYQTEIEDLQKSRKEILRKAKEEVEQLMQEEALAQKALREQQSQRSKQQQAEAPDAAVDITAISKTIEH